MTELRKVVRIAAPQLSEAIKCRQWCRVDGDGKAVLALMPHSRHANVRLFDAAGPVDAFPRSIPFPSWKAQARAPGT